MQADENQKKNLLVVLEGDPRAGAISAAAVLAALPDHLHSLLGQAEHAARTRDEGTPSTTEREQAATQQPQRRHRPITSYAQPQLQTLTVKQLVQVHLWAESAVRWIRGRRTGAGCARRACGTGHCHVRRCVPAACLAGAHSRAC